MEASEEPRDASAGRWQAGALPASAGVCCLMARRGRTGAVGVPHRVAPRSSGHRHAAQLVSTQALGEVQSAPDDAQRGATGRTAGRARGRGLPWGGGPSRGWPGPRAAGGGSRAGRAQRAWSKPQWRTCHEAVRQDMREEPAETLYDVQGRRCGGGPGPRSGRCT